MTVPEVVGAALCSRITREVEEDPAATATEAISWVVAFRAPQWGSPALEREPDLAEITQDLDGVAVVLAEPPPAGRRRRRQPGQAAGFLAGTLPGGTWRRDVAGSMTDLVKLLHQPAVRQALTAGRDPGVGTLNDRPAYLVCADGAGDRCCGEFGAQAADAVLASLPVRRRVWSSRPVADVHRCSDLGGHRFAPTALVLPWGFMFGGLGPDGQNLAFAVGGVLSDRPILEGYRGRTTFPARAQAAEIAVRQRLVGEGSPVGRDDLRVEAVTRPAGGSPVRDTADPDQTPPGDPAEVEVVVRHVDGRRFRVRVRADEQGATRPTSCGAPPTPIRSWGATIIDP
jgi:hypothetical protein